MHTLLEQLQQIDRRDLKLLAELKLKIEVALSAQREGHSDKWQAVQDQLDLVDDTMDCEELVKS